jgi:hypothetical protein
MSPAKVDEFHDELRIDDIRCRSCVPSLPTGKRARGRREANRRSKSVDRWKERL